jgi:hypothetical protein
MRPKSMLEHLNKGGFHAGPCARKHDAFRGKSTTVDSGSHNGFSAVKRSMKLLGGLSALGTLQRLGRYGII